MAKADQLPLEVVRRRNETRYMTLDSCERLALMPRLVLTATINQSFVVTLATQGHAWVLSSQNAVSMGRTSSGSKFVDITFSQ